VKALIPGATSELQLDLAEQTSRRSPGGNLSMRLLRSIRIRNAAVTPVSNRHIEVFAKCSNRVPPPLTSRKATTRPQNRHDRLTSHQQGGLALVSASGSL
jgi:hypothetical protein